MKAATEQKTIRQGSLSVQIRRYADQRFGFDYSPPGSNGGGQKRKKVRKTTLAEAEKRARELLGIAVAGKVERLAIDENEYVAFLQWKAERGSGGEVAESIVSFLEAKESKGVSRESLRKWRHDLLAFSRTFAGRRLDSVSRREVEGWLAARHVGPRRFNNLLATLVSLNRFARKDGAIHAGPCGAELIERRSVAVNVGTYAPAELMALLGVVEKEWVPAIALGAFCGLRPQEACPEPRSGKPGLKWENILWTKRKVDVPANVSKTRKRRFAPFTDAALAFLMPYRDRTGPVAPRERFCKYTSTWARAVGMEWKPDALRHSFASYRLALIKDTAALALEMGNSPAIIFAHYLDLKHEDEAEAWFAIRPVPKVPSVQTASSRKAA